MPSTISWRDPEHIDMTIYPGVHHSFDLPMRGPYRVAGTGGRFHTVQGNDSARRDSQARMIRFFAAHLGPAR